MNSQPTEGDRDFCVEWRALLRNAFTKDEIAEIISALELNYEPSSCFSNERAEEKPSVCVSAPTLMPISSGP